MPLSTTCHSQGLLTLRKLLLPAKSSFLEAPQSSAIRNDIVFVMENQAPVIRTGNLLLLSLSRHHNWQFSAIGQRQRLLQNTMLRTETRTSCPAS